MATAHPENTPATAPVRPALPMMQVSICGRVEEVQRFDGMYATRIICPAADEYSQPQNIKIRSKTRIASRDEVITVVARLGGYKRKPFKATDKDSGEIVSVVPVDMTLDLVE